MANPRDLAEQAFALLQDALRESEKRVQSLDAQLKRQPLGEGELGERLHALTQRLEALESDRAQWEEKATQFEEVAEAERAKVAQLKKRLEIAESGPDKLTKREINFWRGRAEQFDKDIAEYKSRLASLRRELIERDALLERLRSSDAADAAAGEVRETLGNETAPRDDTSDSAEAAVAAPTTATADTADTAAALAAAERAAQEAQNEAEHLRAVLAEREHRLAELTAETEHIRSQAQQWLQQVETLRQQAEHRNEGDAASDAARAEREARIGTLERDLGEAQASLESTAAELGEARAALERAAAELEQTRSAANATTSELEQTRSTLHAATSELEQTRATLQSTTAELEQTRSTLQSTTAELEQTRSTLQLTAAELEQALAAQQARDEELATLRDTVAGAERERDEWSAARNRFEQDAEELRGELDRLRSELDEAVQAHRSLEQESASLRAQFAELETELKDEREHSANMSELANERRERITKLEEQVEEANERYEEAKWRLGKAQHFERLVKRRKGLIRKLLAALRAKMKANRALKAGLDGLRRFKAASEANQHKLLARLETLKSELHEAREALDRQDASAESARVRTELAAARERCTELDERIATQVEIIETLEADLKLARAAQRSSDEKTTEIERLRKEIEQRDTLIAALQAESNEHQRKLGKLRGSESETMRLRAISEQDRATIEALEHELAKLKAERGDERVSERTVAR